MCMFAQPDIPAAPQARITERSPDNGDPTARTQDRAKRRLALASSIFTPVGGLGMPQVSGPMGGMSLLGVGR